MGMFHLKIRTKILNPKRPTSYFEYNVMISRIMHSNKYVHTFTCVGTSLLCIIMHAPPHHEDRSTSDLHVTYPGNWKAASRNTHVLHTVQLLQQFTFTTHIYINIMYHYCYSKFSAKDTSS